MILGYVARLSRKGMTVRKLFNEYRSEHPDGFQESVFKRAIRQYRFHTTVVGHVEHYAADQMYVDFAGDKLEVVDEMTGEVKKAEVFVAILDKINLMTETGEITLHIVIERNDVSIGYAITPSEASVNGTPDNKADDPIVKLEKQDMRNKEIAVEKTVADTKKQILEADMTEAKFGQDEERMVYYFMLSSLRKEHFSAVGLTEKQAGYLSDDEKMEIVSNLNAKTKAVIRRDYLIANFKEAFGSNTVAKLLLGFAKKHMPEQLAEIEKAITRSMRNGISE